LGFALNTLASLLTSPKYNHMNNNNYNNDADDGRNDGDDDDNKVV